MTVLIDGLALLLGWIVAVTAPLAIAAIDGRDRHGRRSPLVRAARAAAIPTGVLAAIALALPAGAAALALTVPYALVTVGLGVEGLRRIALGGRAAAIATAGGLVLWPGAALWLCAHRAGVALLDYPPLWVGLTAAHFHVAGAFLPIIIGRAAHDRGRAIGAIAIACVISVPLTAAGIAGPRWLETAAAIGMAGAGLGAALVLIVSRRWLARGAGAALAVTMTLALGYALRGHGPTLSIGALDPLSSMLVVHGALNVGAFATLGLIATAQAGALACDPPPLSRLRGGWHIGPDFFSPRAPAPGLVDSLADLAHAELDVAAIAPAVRQFYEHTGAHAMRVRPHWRRGFRLGARVWHRVARAMGQLDLPIRAEAGTEGITSRVVTVGADDGRHQVRAWIRQFADGRAMYVAAYATHRHRDRAYMNIAFPLIGGSFTSILRMDRRGAGVIVSTRVGGDAGIYYVLRAGPVTLPIRLPLAETIEVWPVDDAAVPAPLRAWAPAEATTVARHRVWLFGIEFVALDYAMWRSSAHST